MTTATEASPAPWWKRTAPGTEVPVALVKIDRVKPMLSWRNIPKDAALKRRARYTAGVEYIGRAFGAAEPLRWHGDSVMLFLGGILETHLPAHAFRTAKEIWERVQIDLHLPASIAVHVTHVHWNADTDAIIDEGIGQCNALVRATPTGSIVLSEDVALALPAEDRRDLAPIGSGGGDTAAYVFPASMAARKGEKDVLPGPDSLPLWQAFRRYAHSSDVRLLRYVGFRLQNKPPPALDVRDVFVPPELELRDGRDRRPRRHATREPAHPVLSPGAPWSRAAEGDYSPPRKVALRELFTEHRSTVIVGDPGSGKTTLLRWLAVTAAAGSFAVSSALGSSERLLPLPVSVGRLAEVRRGFPGESPSVPAALARYFHDRGIGEEGWLHKLLVRELERGHCLVLLDGLDEISSGERREIHEWLEAFTQAFPDNRFVASSRIVGYTGFDLPDAVTAVVQPFSDAQVERYIRALITAYTRKESGADEPDQVTREATRLLSAIRASPRLNALAKNPFLLSALALIHRSEGRLPRHRVQAYELFARALCETWADARRLVAGKASDATIAYDEEALPVLGELARSMHERYPAGVAPEAFVTETLARVLNERKGVAGDEAQRAARAFLEKAGERVQILLERGAGQWGFLHLTFQEFFAAAGLHATEQFEAAAFAHLFDPRWEEVLRLGMGYLALIQKRPIAAQRFVEKVLSWEEPEPRSWVTGLLKKQIPLAALLAAEAGDALPLKLQERIAEELADWVCDPPSTNAAHQYLRELTLTDFSERVAPVLLRKLEENPKLRLDAVVALSSIHALDAVQSSALQSLMQSLTDSNKIIRLTAILALMILGMALPGAVDKPEVLSRILLATNDESPEVRKCVCLTLGVFPIPSAKIEVVLLERARHDSNNAVRYTAARALRGFASKAATEAMFSVLVGVDAPFEKDILRLVEGLNGKIPLQRQLLAASGTKDTRIRTRVLLALTQLVRSQKSREPPPEEVRRVVLHAVNDAGARVRNAAIGSVSIVDPANALQVLLAALHDPNVEVRATAANELAMLPPQAALVSPLVAALQDEYAQVRRACVEALGQHRSKHASRAILTALRDSDATVRAAAAMALGRRKSKSTIAAIKAALDDESGTVRRVAAEALAQLDPVAAVPLIVPHATRDPVLRELLWNLAESPTAA